MQLRVSNERIIGGQTPLPQQVFKPQEFNPYISSMPHLLSPDHAAMRPLNTLPSRHTDVREIWTGWMHPMQLFKPYTGTQGMPTVVPVQNNLQPYEMNVM